MTTAQAIETIRIALGERGEHHPNCNSHKQFPCDCYAHRRQLPHKALDILEADAGKLSDDDIAITLAWLQKIGFHPDGAHIVLRDFGPQGNCSIQVYGIQEWHLNGTRTKSPLTRGEARRLFIALGIHMKE